MAPQTIDLRKPPRQSQPEGSVDFRKVQNDLVLPLEWTAHEYEKRERGPYWFFLPASAALLLVIIGILTRSYFFIVFVTLALVTILMYAQRLPRELRYKITKEGVLVDAKIYPFQELKSFWIFTREPSELSLQTVKTLAPFIRLPLGKADREKIKEALGRFLPEEEHKDFISDKIARNIGF